MPDQLTILHINIQSITNSKINETKKILFENLIAKTKPNFISLNETFLKEKNKLHKDGFNILRSDRTLSKGGGAALAIHCDTKFEEIKIEDILNSENAVGAKIETSDNKDIAIFSIYNPPKQNLNQNLFNFVHNNFKNCKIIGDLNAKNKLWHCSNENIRGILLEQIASKHNLNILNSKQPTFKRGKSIIDLTICSNNMRSLFAKHEVLKNEISDHYPTLSIFKTNNIILQKYSFFKTNWKTFKFS